MKSITIEELNHLIIDSEKKMDSDQKSTWDEIKIEPVKWIEDTKGNALGGFWVVAILQFEVIWFNDITKGFNISTYSEPGEIYEYWSEDTALPDLLWHLF